MESTYRVTADVSHQRVDETVFILDLASGEYFSLNDTGAQIWSGLVDGKSLDAILGALVERYGAAAGGKRLEEDLFQLVEELQARRLIQKAAG